MTIRTAVVGDKACYDDTYGGSVMYWLPHWTVTMHEYAIGHVTLVAAILSMRTMYDAALRRNKLM